MSGCDLRAAAAQTPLSVGEVEWLLAADVRALLREPVAARTLVQRMRATLAAHAGELRALRSDVTRMGEEHKMRTSPLTAAVLALGRLGVDDQRQVFSAYAEGLLDTLREQAQQARLTQLAAETSAVRVRLVLGQLLTDDTLPAEVRDRIRDAVGRLPEPTDVAAAEQQLAVAGPELPALREPVFTTPPVPPTATDQAPGDPADLADLFD